MISSADEKKTGRLSLVAFAGWAAMAAEALI
jgi:hypothetical protein